MSRVLCTTRAKKCKTKHIVFVVLAFVCFVLTQSTLAQVADKPKPAESPCDPRYFKSLRSSAWEHAEREITHNQSLIFKPDSVLEYSCFTSLLDQVAGAAAGFFSEKKWSLPGLGPIPISVTILPSDSMDNALESLVNSSLRNWLWSNFGFDESHPDYFAFLGGRLNPGPPTLGPTGPILDYQDPITRSVQSRAYSCRLLEEVWMYAKCLDVIDVKQEDGWFVNFAAYKKGPDKRFLPKRCPGIQNIWFQHEPKQPPFSDINVTPWIEDDVNTYLELINPDNCGRDIAIMWYSPNLTPVFDTGLMIKNKNFPTGYKEKICIPPGCYYQPDKSDPSDGMCIKNIDAP